MNKISVIVPVYNVENEVSRCINSILSQTYKNIEIILIDDGSEDESPAILDRYGENYCNIRIIHQENKGLSSARNAGLDICTGEFVAFVDSDDYIENNMFEEMITAMVETDADISICGRFDEFLDSNKNVQVFTKTKKTIYTKDEAMKKILLWNEMDIAAWDKLYKVDLWKEIRFPLSRNNEDICTIPKVIANANNIVHVGKPLYHYCHRSGSITTTYNEKKIKDFYNAIQSMTSDVTKYYNGLSEALIYFKNHSFLWLWLIGEEICYRGDEIQIAKQYLSENWKNPCSYNKFSRRDKIKYILLKLGLYRMIYKDYHYLMLLMKRRRLIQDDIRKG